MAVTYEAATKTITLTETNNTLETLFLSAPNAASGNTGVFLDRTTLAGISVYNRKGARMVIASTGVLTINNQVLTDDGTIANNVAQIVIQSGGTLTLGSLGASIPAIGRSLPIINASGIIGNSASNSTFNETTAFLRVESGGTLNIYSAFLIHTKTGAVAFILGAVINYERASIRLVNGSLRQRSNSVSGRLLYLSALELALIGNSPNLSGFTPYYCSLSAIGLSTSSDPNTVYRFLAYEGYGNLADVGYKSGGVVNLKNPIKDWKTLTFHPHSLTDANQFGVVYASFSYTPQVINKTTKTGVSNTRLYLIDSNSSRRVTSTTPKYNYSADKVVNILSDNTGFFAEQELIVTVRSEETQATAKVDPPYDIRTPFNGVFASYGYNLSLIIGFEPNAVSSPIIELEVYPVAEPNPGIVAAYLINIDHARQLITLAGNVSLRQLEDFCRLDKTTSTGINKPTTSSHVIERQDKNFTSFYSINTGEFTLSGTTGESLNLGVKTFTGIATIPVTDLQGLRFKFLGLPLDGNPRVRVRRVSDDTRIYLSAVNGEAQAILQVGVEYIARADAEGYERVVDIPINTGSQTSALIILPPIRNSDGSNPFPLAVQGEVDCLSYDYATMSVVVRYVPNFPSISAESALVAVEKFQSGAFMQAGLDQRYPITWQDGKLLFANESLTRIKAHPDNTGIPFLNFEIIHSGFDTPHRLFDFSNGKVFSYLTTQNLAKFSGSLTTTTDNAAIAAAVNNALVDDFAAVQNSINNIEVDVDVSSIVAGVEGSQLLAKQEVLNILANRLTADRATFLDKLNVAGELANSDTAGFYRADVSALLTTTTFVNTTNSVLTSIGTRATNQGVWEYTGSRALTTEFPAPSVIATATRTELTTELARIDTAVSSRATNVGVNDQLVDDFDVLGQSIIQAIASIPAPVFPSVPTVEAIQLGLASKSELTGLISYITPILDKLYVMGGHDISNPVSAFAPTATVPGWIRSADGAINQAHVKNTDGSFTLRQLVE